MSLQGLRIGFFAFFALSAGVAGNLLLLQPDPSGSGATAKARHISPSAYMETASLERATPRPKPHVRPVGTASKPTVLNPDFDDTANTSLRPGQIGVRGRFLPVNTGNTAELVRALQRELKNKGYDPGAEDGATGLLTRAAIFAYEYDHKLGLTAEPSEQLLQTIVLGRSSQRGATRQRARIASGAARDLVLVTQRGLKKQGLWPASVDGHFNTALSRAIQRFETAQRLPTTGRISGRFMARLARLSGFGQVTATAARR